MAPTHNLLRAYCAPDAVELRSAEEGSTLSGHFAVFGQWTEINSAYEGHFLERIAPGAFARAEADPSSIKVMFNHGKDPSMGQQLLGTPTSITQDDHGARYEVALFDGNSHVEDLKPALRKGAYGASFRFSVADSGDQWTTPTRSAEHNPNRLQERTITDVHTYEFGPVSFPAYAGATAGMRSLDDEPWVTDRDAALYIARFADRIGLKAFEKILAQVPEDLRTAITEPTRDEDLAAKAHATFRRHWMAEHLNQKAS